MKLSELIQYKNNLDALSTRDARIFANGELEKLTHLTNSTELEDNLNSVNKSFDAFDATVDKLKAELKIKIEEAERPWFQESYRLYEGELNSEANTILNLRKTTDSNIERYRDRLHMYADWHYPAMIIRPGLETFIDSMVAFDPLYLVDIGHDYLLPALDKFNEQYRNRLRSYTIKENEGEAYLSRIPDNQFGLIFAYNYFNFRPFEILKQYLLEIHQKLKAGGTFIMTFNDCDRASAVKLVEQYYSCYTPGYLVRQLAESMGFEIAYSFNDHGPTTWLELKKPGELTSIKGGQTLAKILPKQL